MSCMPRYATSPVLPSGTASVAAVCKALMIDGSGADCTDPLANLHDCTGAM